MAYSIKDLEHLSGIKAHTLRIWEQRYDILKPKRTDTNIRYYDDHDLKLILNISMLNDNGYKISKIAEMTPGEMHKEVVSLTESTYKYPEQIQALTLSMIDLDEDRFEKVISTNILHFGFEKTMLNIVFPFLNRIGFLWQTGSINPAQEHFITFLIRQKLIVAIDGLVNHKHENAKRFMLYLPQGEMHETSLLFSNFLIRSRKHKVIYLGQSLPFEDVKVAHGIYDPDYVLCFATTSPGQSEIQQYLDMMAIALPETQILLSGYQIVAQDLELAPNMHVITNIDDLINLLEGINLGK
jgi:DNA-binding transcriptional MerR regulator